MRTITRWTAIGATCLCLLLAGAAPVNAAPAATPTFACGWNGHAVKNARGILGPCLDQTQPGVYR